jgi:hypothetical protein
MNTLFACCSLEPTHLTREESAAALTAILRGGFLKPELAPRLHIS